MEEQEEFRPIPGYEGLYEISNTAHFRSVLSGKLKQQAINNSGYLRAELYKSNNRKKIFTHITVAKVFVENHNPEKFHIVNHLDGDKTNNLPHNLEWTNKSGNQKHAVKIGLTKILTAKPGVTNNQSKLLDQDIKDIRARRNSGALLKDIASIYNVTESNISIICKGKGWKHIG